MTHFNSLVQPTLHLLVRLGLNTRQFLPNLLSYYQSKYEKQPFSNLNKNCVNWPEVGNLGTTRHFLHDHRLGNWTWLAGIPLGDFIGDWTPGIFTNVYVNVPYSPAILRMLDKLCWSMLRFVAMPLRGTYTLALARGIPAVPQMMFGRFGNYCYYSVLCCTLSWGGGLDSVAIAYPAFSGFE